MQKKLQLLKWAVRLSALLLMGIASFGGALPITQADGAPTGTCHLTYAPNATPPGNTKLDTTQVPNDTGLQTTLNQQYVLNCDAPHSSCQLVSGAGDTTLDKSNLSQSSYLQNGLAKFNLQCQGTVTQGGLVTGGTCHLTYAPNATPPGNTKLDASFVPNDTGLQTTLNQQYVLNCDTAHASCQLVSGAGTTTLDKSNLSQSSYLQNGLANFNLSCTA